MTESRRKIDNCSFHLFVATLENLGPQNRTFTVLKDDNLSPQFSSFIVPHPQLKLVNKFSNLNSIKLQLKRAVRIITF